MQAKYTVMVKKYMAFCMFKVTEIELQLENCVTVKHQLGYRKSLFVCINKTQFWYFGKSGIQSFAMCVVTYAFINSRSFTENG